MPDLDLNNVPPILRELITELPPGESVTIVDHQQPVAVLSTIPRAAPCFGGCAGMLEIVAEDDEHLSDFAEYMP